MSKTYLPRLTVARTISGRALARVRYDEPDRCWLWTGNVSNGYGNASLGNGKQARAHRVVYELLVGPIPDGRAPVTAAENTRRQHDATRKPTCPQGHAEWGSTTRHAGEVNRYCKPCARARAQRIRDAKRSH